MILPKRDRMARFQLLLGWIVLIGTPMAILFVVIMSIIEREASFIIVKLIWMPFVFLWGLRQVRSNLQ